MDSVLRAAVMYVTLLVIFRLTGKRSLAQITTFDFVLLLVISEAAQPGLIGNDNSLTNSLVVILTLVLIDIVLSFWKQKLPAFERIVDGLPLVIVENGKPLKDRLDKERVDEEDIMEAARKLHGLERMDQIKFAVLERAGGISIIPVAGARN